MKKIFITGGTAGIGLAVAKEYHSAGWKVGVCGRDPSRLSTEFFEEYPNISVFKADVTNREELHAAVREFARGELDLILANAGRAVGKKTRIPDFKIACELMDLNIKGVLHAFEAALELMIPKKKGHIAAIASVAGMVGIPGMSSYSASKSAVIKLCESYAIDFKELGIDVTTIMPGYIETQLTRDVEHPMPFIMSAEKAAKKIKIALDNKKVIYIFPRPIRILMTIYTLLPRSIYRFVMGSKVGDIISDA